MLCTNGVCLGFRYSMQLCLCVIELHMGVNIQRYADVRMTHDILQCLWIHSGFRHIRTEGVSAYMRSYFGHLNAVNLVIFLNDMFQVLFPMKGRPLAYYSCRETKIQHIRLPLVLFSGLLDW